MKYVLILLALVLILLKLLYLDKNSPMEEPQITVKETLKKPTETHSSDLGPVASDVGSPSIETINTPDGSPETRPAPTDSSINVQESTNVEGSPLVRGEKSDVGSEFGSHLKSESLSPEGSGPAGVITGIKSDIGSDGSLMNKSHSDNGSPLNVPATNPDGTVDDGSSIDANGSNLKPQKN